MHLFTMLRFQDLFIGQIIGILISRKYVGMINFSFENERNTISIWLNANGITHVQREATIGKELFFTIFGYTQGKLGLYPKVPAPGSPPINFTELLEIAVTEMLPPLPISCPMLEQLYLQRDMLRPEKSSSLLNNSRDMLRRIPSGGIETTKLRNLAAWSAFWPTLLFLCGDGRVICSYEQTLGKLLRTFEGHLTAKLTNLFGARALTPFNAAVQEILQNTWPDLKTSELPDPLYGAAPYYTWAKALKEKVPMVGIPTLTHRCFEQALEKLTKQDADLMKRLLQ
jgi:hypothetical protein